MICYLSRNYRGVDNAGNKAKTDIEQIMESHGFRNVGLKQTRYRNVVVAFCRTLFSVLKSILCLRKGDVLVLQYPLKKYYAFVCNMAHLRGENLPVYIRNHYDKKTKHRQTGCGSVISAHHCRQQVGYRINNQISPISAAWP